MYGKIYGCIRRSSTRALMTQCMPPIHDFRQPPELETKETSSAAERASGSTPYASVFNSESEFLHPLYVRRMMMTGVSGYFGFPAQLISTLC